MPTEVARTMKWFHTTAKKWISPYLQQTFSQSFLFCFSRPLSEQAIRGCVCVRDYSRTFWTIFQSSVRWIMTISNVTKCQPPSFYSHHFCSFIILQSFWSNFKYQRQTCRQHLMLFRFFFCFLLVSLWSAAHCMYATRHFGTADSLIANGCGVPKQLGKQSYLFMILIQCHSWHSEKFCIRTSAHRWNSRTHTSKNHDFKRPRLCCWAMKNL